MMPLDGGLGANVERKRYLNQRAKNEPEIVARGIDPKTGSIRLGAKGTDLAFDIEINGIIHKVSIAELKLLRLIAEASLYGKITYLPLISDESKPSYEALLNLP